MILWILLLVLASTLTFDACLTTRRMNEIGIDVELNPVIRWAAKKWGAFLGSTIGLLPHALMYGVFFAYDCQRILCFLAGVRVMLFIEQLHSL